MSASVTTTTTVINYNNNVNVKVKITAIIAGALVQSRLKRMDEMEIRRMIEPFRQQDN